MANALEYTILAKYYDVLFWNTKDYKAEALEIRRAIEKYKKSSGSDLIDVACGTGRHLSYLSKWYLCTGVDLNREMLKLAKKNAKNVRLLQADMTQLRMKKKFDAVTCLFSAIGHLNSYQNLEKAIKNFSALLKPGGILIIDGWFDTRHWTPGYVHAISTDTGRIKIARASFSGRRGRTSWHEDHWLIAEWGKGVRYVVDRQEQGLFERGRFLKMLGENGFRARTVKSPLPGRYRYLGVRL